MQVANLTHSRLRAFWRPAPGSPPFRALPAHPRCISVTVDSPWTVTSVGGGHSPLVIHVPHSGTSVPDDVRRDLLLDDAELAAEIGKMTDWHTDRIALDALTRAGVPATVFTNRASRLVVDPERFVGDDEPMAAIGMGPVYHSTSGLQPLRHPDPARDQQMLDEWFHPYAAAFTELVDRTLSRYGRVVIVDLHSYPKLPSPYELAPDSFRPGICVGTDPHHTPNAVRDAAFGSFSGTAGGVALDTPFAGTYVPLAHLGRTPEVTSVMIEIRRDLYQVEPGGPLHGGYDTVVGAVGNFLSAVVRIGT